MCPEPVPDLLNATAPRASLLSKDLVTPSGWLQAISVPLPGPQKGKDVVSDKQLLYKVLGRGRPGLEGTESWRC